ncbi:MAG: hypothetical protein ACTSRZ_13980 [Promethearchaeota archaeon]
MQKNQFSIKVESLIILILADLFLIISLFESWYETSQFNLETNTQILYKIYIPFESWNREYFQENLFLYIFPQNIIVLTISAITLPIFILKLVVYIVETSYRRQNLKNSIESLNTMDPSIGDVLKSSEPETTSISIFSNIGKSSKYPNSKNLSKSNYMEFLQNIKYKNILSLISLQSFFIIAVFFEFIYGCLIYGYAFPYLYMIKESVQYEYKLQIGILFYLISGIMKIIAYILIRIDSDLAENMQKSKKTIDENVERKIIEFSNIQNEILDKFKAQSIGGNVIEHTAAEMENKVNG